MAFKDRDYKKFRRRMASKHTGGSLVVVSHSRVTSNGDFRVTSTTNKRVTA